MDTSQNSIQHVSQYNVSIETLKGYFTSGKMKVYLKWVIYGEKI